MKIAPLFVASATALETSTSASALLSAIGKRNVTHMESLIQGLAEESIKTPAWKFDKDIQDALDAIRTMFVSSIQTALRDQHKVDQEAHNCNTEECYKGCNDGYTTDEEKCHGMTEVCEKKSVEHKECRTKVFKLYKDMAKKCSDLHCFMPPKIDCRFEECICPDVLTCYTGKKVTHDPKNPKLGGDTHDQKWEEWTKEETKHQDEWAHVDKLAEKGSKDKDGKWHSKEWKGGHQYAMAQTEAQTETRRRKIVVDEYGDEGTKYICKAKDDECRSKGFGTWLLSVVKLYDSEWDAWYKLWSECSEAYREFLYEDVKCDGVQREFEKCMCERDFQSGQVCEGSFTLCHSRCRAQYDADVPNLQCQEKDRKIDWSATKKIECYLDVLLHDYSEKELLDECGSKDCVNVARESAYKHCSTICQNVDHNGEWPNVDVNYDGEWHKIDNHEFRKKHEDKEAVGPGGYHLGDTKFKCDLNGDNVFTPHRGGWQRMLPDAPANRQSEYRCTEHLDIDYQIPPCVKCRDPLPPVCSDYFHCKYYEEFDKTCKIGCINDCCPEDAKGKGGCFPDVKLTSCTHKDCDETGENCDAYAMGTGEGYPFKGPHWDDWKGEITFGEHTYAWAYNRCECMECTAERPSYPEVTYECGSGVHTWGKDAYGL